jgi:hypothetical protein
MIQSNVYPDGSVRYSNLGSLYSSPMMGLGGVGSTGYGNPDQTMANILRGQQQFRNQIYTPLENDVLSQIGDGSLVDAARDAAQQNLGGTAERAERMASRYGGLSSPLQAAELSRKAKLGDATAATGLVNNARIAQDERDQGLQQSMINYYRGVQGNAMGGLSEAANSQVSRENAVSQANAARRAQQTQMVGSLAASALMMAFLL